MVKAAGDEAAGQVDGNKPRSGSEGPLSAAGTAPAAWHSTMPKA
ncbi:hypothetical protein Sgleb_14230 [Streptomyces glebosus]|uniref:Uncharacterized protein n=1 Tax=Streptomyces glebosus TaxID=249580 RepID=A0A640STD7_9ACTN|nr:hypothetical protein [Streptomyces glebosus]GFE13376.1 hypothetical protein Sgleb_14230 [Streptomyces glebosus]GHG66209.1 hypothetical protein GCM10010513_35090 [Streptomyces glebosus]